MPHFHVACEGLRRSLAPRTIVLLAPALALTSWFKSSACASSSSYLLLEQEICVVHMFDIYIYASRRYVFTFWFDTEKALFQVILGLLLLSVSVRRLKESGHMSKSVYVRVVHDLELLRYFFIVRLNDSFHFRLGLIKYIVIC